ncbi:hypothetical protein PFISCL1PPCAC_20454 [Pristionchus fissidentatus]|uniref:Zinc carboxypeptidase A 1 n=1 Tax=Pristionchus fissidentatus TaxID=1538716 RepID=A0AAV5WGT8_9BILA|nr:hypothetical protein PFISCL1PPCAC_20454 [Pristionchus fissidentatus]
MRLAVCILLAAAVAAASTAQDEPHSYRNFKLIRINPENDATLSYLKSLYEEESPYTLDFWQPPSHVGGVVDLTVAPSDASSLIRDLSARGIHYIVAIHDLQKAIESEKSLTSWAHPPKGFGYERYNSVDEIYNELKRLKRERPSLITLIDIGQTHENRTMLVVKIGGGQSLDEDAPSVWLDAGIHAREWIAPATAMFIVRELVEGYDVDPKLQAMIDHVPFYILPVMNPDGYEYSRTSDRMWRKNRRPAECQHKDWHTVCCRGVDLNRNFDWYWAVSFLPYFSASGSSSDSCHDTYHGPAAFSEPESMAVRDFLEAYPPKAFISLHSYSQMWLIPFGHRRRSYPADYSSALRPLALRATKALEAVHGTKYQVGTGADLMYEASGGSHDWAKGALKVPFSYLIELRPRNTLFGNGFLLPEREIAPVGNETWAAIRVVADEVFSQFAQPSLRGKAGKKPETPLSLHKLGLRGTSTEQTTAASRSEPTVTETDAPTTVSPSTTVQPETATVTIQPRTVVVVESTVTPVTLATVTCEDYGSYCRLWKVFNLCDRRAVHKLCALTCNPQCRV